MISKSLRILSDKEKRQKASDAWRDVEWKMNAILQPAKNNTRLSILLRKSKQEGYKLSAARILYFCSALKFVSWRPTPRPSWPALFLILQ